MTRQNIKCRRQVANQASWELFAEQSTWIPKLFKRHRNSDPVISRSFGNRRDPARRRWKTIFSDGDRDEIRFQFLKFLPSLCHQPERNYRNNFHFATLFAIFNDPQVLTELQSGKRSEKKF